MKRKALEQEERAVKAERELMDTQSRGGRPGFIGPGRSGKCVQAAAVIERDGTGY